MLEFGFIFCHYRVSALTHTTVKVENKHIKIAFSDATPHKNIERIKT